jgi:hypothetical protein
MEKQPVHSVHAARKTGVGEWECLLRATDCHRGGHKPQREFWHGINIGGRVC